MKFTLAYSPDSQAEALPILQTIAEFLKEKKQGYSNDGLKKGGLGRQQKAKYYNRLRTNIRNSDGLIVEISDASTELGFLVSEALAQRKPVLALLSKSSDTQTDDFLTPNRSKFLKTERYCTDNLEEILDDFIEFAAKRVDTKFILIITPEIDAYLRWKAKEEGMRKAEVVRTAVEQHMKSDKKFQQKG